MRSVSSVRSLLVALAILTLPLMAGAADSLPTDSIFSANSFWYKPLPADVPLHPKSAEFVQEFLRQKAAFYGTVSINTTSYSSPVYVVEREVATVRVSHWLCNPRTKPHPSLLPQWEAVPIPAYAEPAKGKDGEMTIYQPATDTIWEFWKMRKTGDGRWEACWGGRMQNVSKSDGIWHAYYGTTATGLPFLGGQITAEELRRGEIRHVIGIALVEVEAHNVVSWPARRSDGWNSKKEPNRIPEGLRFRLDPSVDVDALKMKPAGKVIAKAAQRYGFVVWDKGGAIVLRAQNAHSYTALGQPNPYPELFGGPAWAVLQGFPWDRLQFLPHDYGKP
jgi:hypothetical protein